MNLSRRTFLGGVLACSAVAIVRPPGVLIPTIFGDGIHDDAPGLNALVSGLPVDIRADAARILSAGEVFISGGTFMLGSPIIIKRGHPPVTIWGCYFRMLPAFEPAFTGPTFRIEA